MIRIDKGWGRFLGLVLGFLSVVAGLLAIVMPDLAIITLTLVLGFGLLFTGAKGIILSFVARGFSERIRYFRMSVGLISIVISLIVFSFRETAVGILILLLSVGLLFQGAWRVVAGWSSDLFPSNLRIFYIVSGIFFLVFSAMVIWNPELGRLTLVYLLALLFLINGFGSIFSGISWD